MLVDITCVDYLHYPGADRPLRRGLSAWPARRRASGSPSACISNEPDLTVPSVVPLWEGADWMEREVYDMYGIVFDGHPDLRRILMPEEFTALPAAQGLPAARPRRAA